MYDFKNRSSLLNKRLDELMEDFGNRQDIYIEGKLLRTVGLTLEATGFRASVGSTCLVSNQKKELIETEIIGFSENKIFLMAKNNLSGLLSGSRVIPFDRPAQISVGPELLGRVLDGQGKPFDGKPEIKTKDHYPLQSLPINPLLREPIHEPMDVGIQAINSLLTIGRGQRIGLFAGSGVGKSVLLGMMTRYTAADVVVVGLIGERGREVQEFLEKTLGESGLARAVVVAVPADYSPLLRLQGAMLATTIAEYFRDQGQHVLLLMDSLTRFAQAQREISLAVGEPPATKGYTPSVFSKLAQLVERAGNGPKGGGSITAFYTVLAEGDDQQDPIADAARAILDGHIVLSREIAAMGHFPAIDIEQSISRVMPDVTSAEQQSAVLKFRSLYSKYQQYKDLINIGAYTRGSDPMLDRAIQVMPYMLDFLRQDIDESHALEVSVETIINLAQQWSNDGQGQALPAITHAR